MLAARIHPVQGTLRVDTVPDPQTQPGEALVRVRRLGVGPSDGAQPSEQSWAGAESWIPGHEVAGVVEQVNIPADAPQSLQDRRAPKGRRVVVSPSIAC